MKRLSLKDSNKKGKGFTIVEVLIVIVIIAILFTVIFIAVGDIKMKSRNTKRGSDMGQVNKALQLYQNDVGSYPDCDYNGLKDSLVSDYIGGLPEDPLDSDCHIYLYDRDASTYTLEYCKEPGCDDCPELKP